MSSQPKTIDPTDSKNLPYLQQIVENNPHSLFLPTTWPYSITVANNQLSVKLEHPIAFFTHPSKKKRYISVMQALESEKQGNKSIIYNELCVWKAKQEMPYQKKERREEKKLLVKRPKSTLSLGEIQHEHQLTQKFPHLGVKKYGADKGLLFMRKLQGHTLREVINNLKNNPNQLSIEEYFKLTLSLLDLLSTQAQSGGVIHRDIKPENIIINEDLTPWLIDYGCATTAKDIKENEIETNQSVGTPLYMAPEYASGEANASIETDLYAMIFIIAELWGDTKILSIGQKNDEITLQNYKEEVAFANLFHGMKGLPKKIAQAIEQRLLENTRRNPKERNNYEEIKKQFQKISESYSKENSCEKYKLLLKAKHVMYFSTNHTQNTQGIIGICHTI